MWLYDEENEQAVVNTIVLRLFISNYMLYITYVYALKMNYDGVVYDVTNILIFVHKVSVDVDFLVP